MDASEHDVPLLRPRELFDRPAPIPELRLRGLTGEVQPGLVIRTPPGSSTSNSDSSSSSSDSGSSSTASCGPNDTSGPCQRSTGSSDNTVPIVIGVVIPLTIAAIILFVLHRRHRLIQRKEDAEDKYKSMDFGYDEKAMPKPAKSTKSMKSIRGRKASKKEIPEMPAQDLRNMLRKDKGISMDLDMTNPYLLPPELQGSRESLHSLSRNVKQGDDRYRPTDFIPDDGSIRSPSVRGKRDDSSSFTSRTEMLPRPSIGSRTNSPAPPAPPAKALLGVPKLADTDRNSAVSTVSSNGQVAALRASNNYLGAFISGGAKQEAEKKESTTAPTTTVTDLGTTSPGNDPQSPPDVPVIAELPARSSSIYEGKFELPANESFQLPREPRLPQLSITPDPHPAPPAREVYTEPPSDQPRSAPLEPLYENTQSQYHQQHYDQQGYPYRQEYYDEQEYHQQDQYNRESYARNSHQQPTLPNIQVQQHEDDDAASDYYDDEEGYGEYADYMAYTHGGGMMGMRPLPPDDPSENPEQRANRIRSFYKEYFDDSADPAKRRSYFPDDGAFDDVYSYYEQSHPYYRAPSAISARQRAFSNGSYMPGPRAFSSMSGGRYGGPRMKPKKKLPPPKALQLLPTPHKLKDDSFLPNAIDYAPPQMFKNQRSGTPDSLRGGLRPYSPSVRPHIPLASSFDDLAAIPSPHALRKSGLFTALDFAPPRSIRGPDSSMSETGSIRSNRSGISAMHQHNIRAGAYRVSRIPKQVAGTRQDLMEALKPQWNMNR